MIEVYHNPPMRSVRVIWALEEMGVPYVVRPLQWPVEPEYLTVNPSGTVPAVIDDGEIMTESLAICDVLSRRHGGGQLIVQPDDRDYAKYLELLWYGEATLPGQLAPVMHYGPFVPEELRIPRAVEDGIAAFARRLPFLERHLEGRSFAVGERLTLADVSVVYGLLIGQFVQIQHLYGPNTAGYLGRLLERPALQKALAGPA